MRRVAAVLGASGVGLVAFAVAISIPGSAAVTAGPAWAGFGDGAAVTAAAPSTALDPRAETSTLLGSATSTGSAGDSAPATPPGSPASQATTSAPTASVTSPESANPWTGPEIAPAPATRLRIASIAVDASVVPVDSTPTGERNAWGGEVYGTIDFPVDGKVRQWVRRGDANSVSASEARDNVKAFDRLILYGHASDIGNHLIFQDLSAVRPGDDIIVDTELGTFTYRATSILTREKSDLDSLPELYEYPRSGAKEIALVACLPDTSSNVVVLGTLAAASRTEVGGSTNGGSEATAP